MPNKLIKIGSIGSIVTALCCFTPVLVIVLSGIGLSALLVWLDYLLLPLLAVFILVLGIGLWQMKSN